MEPIAAIVRILLEPILPLALTTCKSLVTYTLATFKKKFKSITSFMSHRVAWHRLLAGVV